MQPFTSVIWFMFAAMFVCTTIFDIIDELNGRKILIRGNHDNFKIGEYLKHFEDVQGICKYKGFWVSHAPIHPAELRGGKVTFTVMFMVTAFVMHTTRLIPGTSTFVVRQLVVGRIPLRKSKMVVITVRENASEFIH
jgi:calcineurin-like phosphoesterase family protein